MRHLKTIMLLLVAAALTFGCSNDNNEKKEKLVDSKEFSLVLKLENKDIQSRAVGETAHDKATTFSSGVIAFVDKDGRVTRTVEIIGTGTSNQETVSVVDLQTGYKFEKVDAAKVYVYGNYGGLINVTKGMSIADVNNTVLDKDGLAGGDYNAVPLYGTAPISPGTGDEHAEAAVAVAPIAARIEIASISANVTYDLAGIWINNYYTAMNADGTESADAFREEDREYYMTTDFSSTPSTTFWDIINSSAAETHAPEAGKVWGYNVFPAENAADSDDDNLPHIIIHLKNIVKGGKNLEKDYFLTIRGYNDGANPIKEFKAGHLYKIGLDGALEWDYDENGGGDIYVDYHDVEVTVSVTKWQTETIYPDID